MRPGLVLFLAFLLLSSSANAASPTFAQRFAGVKRWTFTYTYTSSSPYGWEEGGVQHRRSTWIQTASGSIELKTLNSHGGTMQLEGRGTGSSSYNRQLSESSAWGSETRYDVGSGSPTSSIDVNLDLNEGTYWISISPGDIPMTYGGTQTNAHESRSYGPGNYELEVNVPTPAPAELLLKLPESGRTISGSWSWEQYHAKQPEFRIGGEYNLDEVYRSSPASGTVHWTLIPGDPVDVEVIVEPQGYDDWMPQGGPSEDKAGNTIALKAKLVAKNGGGPPSIKARTFTFALTESSKEKGVALNWPVDGGSGAYDLKFEADKNDDGATIGGDGQSLVTAEGAQEEATVMLSSFDWGAYGTVLVTAQLEDGRVAIGRLQDGNDSQIVIPKRAKTSHIADAWKKHAGFSGDDGEDEDKQDGNDKKGDGLSGYEEYRGLMALGTHTRQSQPMDPMRKTLVVINEAGGEAKPGLKLFKQASDIDVVELKPTEAPQSRLANGNHGSAHRGEQYALRLKAGDLGGAAAGENRPADTYNKTPKLSEEVIIDFGFIRASYAGQADAAAKAGVAMPYTLQDDLDNTVAHEIAHGIGAPHHGKETEWFGKREITDKMVDYHAYGIDGAEVAHPKAGDKPITIEGRIGRPGNDASGDVRCIMCYTNYYQWAVVGPESGPYSFYAVGLQPVGKKFCTSPAGTGINSPRKGANGKDLPGFFGDAKGQGGGASAGNCLGAMKVRDW